MPVVVARDAHNGIAQQPVSGGDGRENPRFWIKAIQSALLSAQPEYARIVFINREYVVGIQVILPSGSVATKLPGLGVEPNHTLFA